MTTLDINPKSPLWAPIVKRLAQGKTVRLRAGKKIVGTLNPNLEITPLHLSPHQLARLNAQIQAEKQNGTALTFDSVEQGVEFLRRSFLNENYAQQPIPPATSRDSPKQTRRSSRGRG